MIHRLTILGLLISGVLPWNDVVADLNSAPEATAKRMEKVIIEISPRPEGNTGAEQYISILWQVSEIYRAKTSHSLKIVFNLDATEALATGKIEDASKVIDGVRSLSLRSVPLIDYLRGLSEEMDLTFKIGDDMVIFSKKPAP